MFDYIVYYSTDNASLDEVAQVYNDLEATYPGKCLFLPDFLSLSKLSLDELLEVKNLVETYIQAVEKTKNES